MLSNNIPNNLQIAEPKYYKCIILDCSMVQFIDETGARFLMEIIQEYKNEDVRFLLANCNSNN
jgi:anti-anti-sigma regulatory factor